MTGSQDPKTVETAFEFIDEGTHVDLISHGHRIGSGVIDEWMPDGSSFWIWLDNGAGRRLIQGTDAVHIVAICENCRAEPPRLPGRS